MPPTREQTRRRVRAALAMGGYTKVEELAKALAERDSGIGLKRLRLMWQTGESRAVERREIAAVCDVPTWFMEEGFGGAETASTEVETRIIHLTDLHFTTAEKVEKILARLDELDPELDPSEPDDDQSP